jgi:hypothetical protein
VLGLEPGANEREVRRAYATRLKAIKNVLNPQDFQALREAYEHALAVVRESSPRNATASLSPLQSTQISTPAPPSGYRANAWDIRIVLPDAPSPQPAQAPDAGAFSDATPGTTPEPKAHLHWRDIASQIDAPERVIPEYLAPEPPILEIDARERERLRMAEVLDRIDTALAAEDEGAARNQFTHGVHSLAHPVDGVSLTALVDFERSLVARLREHRARGFEVHAIFRDVARYFQWAERASDVLSASDPIADVISDFGLADAIWRCARSPKEPDSTVWREFAADLVGPIRPVLFARRILMRKELARRRQKWGELETLHPGVFQWLPAKNIEWWRRALTGPRLVWHTAYVANAWFTAAFVLPLFTILGVRFDPGIFLLLGWVLIASFALLLPAALLQDLPAYAIIRRSAARWLPIHRWLCRILTWGGVINGQIGILFYLPMFGAVFFGLMEMPENEKSQHAGFGERLAMLATAIGVSAQMSGLLLGWRIVKHWLRISLAPRRARFSGLKPWFWGVLIGSVPVAVMFAALLQSPYSLTDMALKLGQIAVGLGVICGVVYGAIRLSRRVPKRWQTASYLVFVAVGFPVLFAGLLVFSGGDAELGFSVGLGLVASIGGVVASIWLAVKGWTLLSTSIPPIFAWLNCKILARVTPALHSRGVRSQHLLAAVPLASGVALFAGAALRLATGNNLGAEDLVAFAVCYVIAVIVLSRKYPRND